MKSRRPKHKDFSFESKDNLKNYVQILVSLNLQKIRLVTFLNLMNEISKVFFTENKLGKINFPFRKTEFGTH